jgi:hypothetical protein
MIDVECTTCGTVHHASPEHLGKRLRCAGCGVPVLIALPPRQGPRSSAIDVETTKAPDVVPAKNRTNLSRVPAIFGRLTWKLWIVLSSLVLAAIVATVGVEFFSNKSSSQAVAKINESPAAKSQEVAPTPSSIPDSDSSSMPTAQDCDERSARRLANGFLLGEEASAKGHGVLRIINGTEFDAVVNLVDSDSHETVRSVYVRNHNRYSFRRLNPGIYRAYFTTGTDWDENEDSFNCNTDYKEFGRSLVLEERTDSRGTEYSELEITLHPVVAGNVVSAKIPKAGFRATLPQRRSQKSRH